jgi:hypothetical protein
MGKINKGRGLSEENKEMKGEVSAGAGKENKEKRKS